MAGFDEKNVFQNRKVGHSIWKKILDGISQEDQPSTEVESRLNGDFWHKCREAMGVKDGRGPNHPGGPSSEEPSHAALNKGRRGPAEFTLHCRRKYPEGKDKSRVFVKRKGGRSRW